MKKIGFLVPEIRNTGPINVVFNIISHLDLNKFEIMLIAIRRSEETEFLKSILPKCALGVIYLNDNKINKKYLEKTLDIIHSHGFYPDKLVSQMDSKLIKKFTTIHSLFLKDYPKEYGILKGTIGALLHFHYLNKGNFTHIVGCSKTIYASLSQKIKRNISFINNGIDQSVFFQLSEQEKNEKRMELGFSQTDKIFIFSGRIIKRKRVPDLINKFNQLDLPNSKLLILGEGQELLNARKKTGKNVHFLGFIEKPQKYYQISDFVLSMSSAEGYPMSILEAVSCGCYAFLSDIPSHREFISLNPSKADIIDNLTEKTLNRRNNDNNYNLSAQKMADEYANIYLN